MTLDEIVRDHVMARLRAFRGDKNAAAVDLDISVRTIYRILDRWNLPKTYGRELDARTPE